MKNVLISGYYGFGNTGDEAILEAMSAKLSKLGINTVVLSASPEETTKTYGVKAVKRFSLPNVLKELRNADTLISGGGSLFQDVTSSVSLYYYLGIVMMARMMGKHTHIFSQGIGPIKNKKNQTIFKKIINGVDSISVRDEVSFEELKRLKIDHPPIKLVSDAVFMLEPAERDIGRQILREAGVESKEGQLLIGLALRRWGSENDLADRFAEVADRITEEFSARVVFFPFHFPQDLNFATEIADKMKNKPAIIQKRYKPSEVLSAIGFMDINIGVRLHALIFSICMGVPVVGISYDPKIDGFLKMLGLEPACTYEQLEWSKLSEEIYKIKNNRQTIIESILKIREEAKKIVCDNLSNLVEAAGL